jgi:hypothetical protein
MRNIVLVKIILRICQLCRMNSDSLNDGFDKLLVDLAAMIDAHFERGNLFTLDYGKPTAGIGFTARNGLHLYKTRDNLPSYFLIQNT